MLDPDPLVRGADPGRSKMSRIPNTAFNSLIFVKPEPVKEVPKDKSRPVSSTPVPGTPWCVVWTGDNR